MKFNAFAAAFLAALFGTAAHAEVANYGSVELQGLAREASWPLNAAGQSYAMVCNVNGPDGFLSVRSGPGSGNAINRSLKRLATVTVDTSQRQGNWVRVLDANREFSTDGQPVPAKSLAVQGWAHDGYLCDFTDYAAAPATPAPTAAAPAPPQSATLSDGSPGGHAAATLSPATPRASGTATCLYGANGERDCRVTREADGSFSAMSVEFGETYFGRTGADGRGEFERIEYNADRGQHLTVGFYNRLPDSPGCYQDVDFAEGIFCVFE